MQKCFLSVLIYLTINTLSHSSNTSQNIRRQSLCNLPARLLIVTILWVFPTKFNFPGKSISKYVSQLTYDIIHHFRLLIKKLFSF
jgi:hypothetical protein